MLQYKRIAIAPDVDGSAAGSGRIRSFLGFLLDLSESLVALASVTGSLMWLGYALVNRSGHTGLDPVNIAKVQLVPVILVVARVLLMRDPLTARSFRILAIAAIFGPSVPLLLEATGVLREYNVWCKAGLEEPSLVLIMAIVLPLAIGLVVGLIRVIRPGAALWRPANHSLSRSSSRSSV
jgi:hypothetical protein